ncbi:TonB-dependent receptor [Dysgonomonas sp. 25]|uniref:SusC/RagA family TonB-linked outer membrane protein n=1 Tax=Dysgonomonas sp. 25 TaxID=2302933 RepID=UPI0013D875FC|nr:TonB-dependent receptor [Dysgonomonas sp. 25]NDV69382.1 TonB-dependent receptor [Dysgonomonas sp. 25]
MTNKKYKLIMLAGLLMSFAFVGAPTAGYAQTGVTQQAGSEITVKGFVKDGEGEPLIGVSVKVKGTDKVVISDIDGDFTVNCKPTDVLQFSYIGYTQQEVSVNGRTSLNVTMKEDAKVLDDVVVIGYGTTTRKSAVGAVDQIKAKMMEDRPVANVQQALQGASPSLVIQQRSMDPNNNTMNVNIRGISTMNNNSPLIVIDGLVSDDNSLNKLNPSDIENISVLKDASTAAIYGSRASNGVVVVTTKTGKKNQRPIVRLSGQVGYQDPEVLFRPVAGWQNATLWNLALTNSGATPKYSPAQIQDLYDRRSEEKWGPDEIFQTALQQQYNVSVSGGSEHTTYMFSAGYYDQESNFVGPNYGIQRYSLRSNITAEYGRFKVTSILGYTRNDNKKSVDGNAIINSTRIPAYYNTRMKDQYGRYVVNDLLTDQNPLAGLHNAGRELNNNDYVNVNLNMEAKIIDGLKLRGIFGAEIFADHRSIRRNTVGLYRQGAAENADPFVYMNPKNSVEDFNADARQLNYQLLLDYNKTFGDHTITALAGITNESYSRKTNEVKIANVDPDLGTPTTGNEEYKGTNSSLQGANKWSIISYLGRLHYSYKDRYYAEGSFRYDGASKFAKDNRWGFFPSASLAWRLSEEEFFNFYKEAVGGDLKLRVTYGVLGNQRIGDYQFMTAYETYSDQYGFNNNSVGAAGFQLGNENIKWEKTNDFNIGLDASFFNGALSVSANYFNKVTKDILLKPKVPTVFGGELNDYNVGEMRNQGWDLTINYFLKTGEFNHNFMANIGDSWNKVLKFEGFEQIDNNDQLYTIIREGMPFKSYYGYKTAGFFKSREDINNSALPAGVDPSSLQPGDVKYVDRNNDGVIDVKDRAYLGNGFPRYSFGLSYDVSYKGFDFSMFWQGVLKRQQFVRGELVEPIHGGYSYVIYKHQLDYWTPTNTGARWPRLTKSGSSHNNNWEFKGSDLYVLDGKYMRLKNIQLGYTIPKHLTQKIGLGKVRAYINGQNLLTFSNNSFIDPESSEFDSNMGGRNGVGANSARNYPSLKYYGFGFDIEF